MDAQLSRQHQETKAQSRVHCKLELRSWRHGVQTEEVTAGPAWPWQGHAESQSSHLKAAGGLENTDKQGQSGKMRSHGEIDSPSAGRREGGRFGGS